MILYDLPVQCLASEWAGVIYRPMSCSWVHSYGFNQAYSPNTWRYTFSAVATFLANFASVLAIARTHYSVFCIRVGGDDTRTRDSVDKSSLAMKRQFYSHKREQQSSNVSLIFRRFFADLWRNYDPYVWSLCLIPVLCSTTPAWDRTTHVPLRSCIGQRCGAVILSTARHVPWQKSTTLYLNAYLEGSTKYSPGAMVLVEGPT